MDPFPGLTTVPCLTLIIPPVPVTFLVWGSQNVAPSWRSRPCSCLKVHTYTHTHTEEEDYCTGRTKWQRLCVCDHKSCDHHMYHQGEGDENMRLHMTWQQTVQWQEQRATHLPSATGKGSVPSASLGHCQRCVCEQCVCVCVCVCVSNVYVCVCVCVWVMCMCVCVCVYIVCVCVWGGLFTFRVTDRKVKMKKYTISSFCVDIATVHWYTIQPMHKCHYKLYPLLLIHVHHTCTHMHNYILLT